MITSPIYRTRSIIASNNSTEFGLSILIIYSVIVPLRTLMYIRILLILQQISWIIDIH